MNHSRYFATATVLSIALLASPAAMATNQPGPAAPPPIATVEASDSNAPDMSGKELATYLGLTSQQLLSWEMSDAELKANLQAIATLSEALSKRLDSSLDSGDACSSGALLMKIRENNARIAAEYDKAKSRFVALLTPTQVTKLNALPVPADQSQQPQGGQ
jgi:hypothetical protein